MSEEMEHISMDAEKTPKPGSAEWLKARIQEHRIAQAQQQAQANAHDGAAQAFQSLLDAIATP